MAITLTLTLDLFLGEWNTTGDLWACVQPHVIDDEQYSALAIWLQNDKGGAFNYVMAEYNNTGTITPVPLSEDLDLVIDLEDGGAPIAISRTTRLSILNPGHLRKLNQPGSEDPNEDPQRPPIDPSLGPFAKSYNEDLRAAFPPGEADLKRLAHTLQLAFWGGTPRWIDATAVDMVVDDGLMILPESNSNEIATNLHSMTGHMIRLGNRSQDLARLRAVRDLSITLRSADGFSVRILLSNQPGGQTIPAFFGNLADTDMDASQLQFSWNASMARRAYARPAQTAFRLQKYGQINLLERRPGASALHGLEAMRQANATLPDPPEGAPPEPSLPPNLTMRPCCIIHGKLERYRGAPDNQGVSPPVTVLSFSPAPADRDRLIELLDADADLFTAVPPRAVLVSDDGAETRRYIGRWRFPWDRTPGGEDVEVLLFNGSTPENPTSVLIIEPAQGHGAFDLQMVGTLQERTTRWSGVPGGMPIKFDGFFAPNLGLSIGRLLLTAEFKGDYAFELAQAASMIEDVALTTVPHPKVNNNGADVTPASDFLADLANYNALNVYSDGVELNPESELYPVFKFKQGGAGPGGSDLVQHSFHFRKPQPALQGPPLPDARLYYRQLYDGLADTRTVSAKLEHTYGQALSFTNGHQIRKSADFSVQLPLIVPHDEQGPNVDLEVPFIAAEYQQQGLQEYVALTINTPLLDPQWHNTRYREFHLAAWRAIAELANADQLELEINGYDFEVFEAITNGKQLVQGLVEQPLFGAAIPVPQLRQKAQDCLDNNFPTNQRITLTVPLTPNTPIGKAVHVIAITLRIVRPIAKVPSSNPADWDLKNVPDPRLNTEADIGGLVVSPAAADAATSFETWLVGLRSGRAPLPTTASGDEVNGPLRAALQAEPGSAAPGDGGNSPLAPSWIAPGTDADPEPGRALLLICPFGFRPLKQNRWFGPRTDVLIRRYMRLLQLVLELKVPWWSGRTDAQWRAHFGRLAGLFDAADPATAHLSRLAEALIALLRPMPNKAQLTNELAALVDELRDNASVGYQNARLAVLLSLLRNFSTFADAKAFLFLRLSGRTDGLPTDFFALADEKSIGSHMVNGSNVERKDQHTVTFREAQIGDNLQKSLDIVEQLADSRFANRFEYRSVALQRFEYLVKKLVDPKWEPTPGASDAYIIPSDVLIPGGSLSPSVNAVYLAAREAVSNPVHIFTGEFEKCQTDAEFALTFDPAGPSRFDLTALKLGKLLPKEPDQPYVEVLFRSNPRPRSVAVDDYVISSVFFVAGNEESTQEPDPVVAFQLDRFYINPFADVPVGVPDGWRPSDRTLALFRALAATNDPSTLLASNVGPPTWADDAILGDVLSDVTHWLIPTHYDPSDVPDVPNAQFAGNDLRVVWPGHDLGNWNADAVLMRVVNEAAVDIVPVFVLLVCTEVTVWDKIRLGVKQTRNPPSVDPAQDFALDFGQVSETSSDVAQYQPILDHISRQAPVKLTDRHLSPAALVARILQDRLIPTDPITQEARRWREFDLVITINHHQQLPMPTQWFDPNARVVVPSDRDLGGSAFPLLKFAFSAQSADLDLPLDLFPAEYRDFSIDFQWTSQTNLHFFRLSAVLVNFR